MPGPFRRNADRLRARDARFAELALSGDNASLSHDRVEIADGPRGHPVVRVDGIQLASAYDPAEEARRSIAPVLEAAPDLIVLIGLGLGHVVETIRSTTSAPVLIYEPSCARLRAALEARDQPWIADRGVCWADTPETLSLSFRGLYTAGLRVGTCVHPVVKRADAASVGDAMTRLANAKRTADIADRTRVLKNASFAEQSVDNLGALLRTPPISRLRGLFDGYPAVIAAAGPSLDRQLDTLAELGQQALVIAIGQSLPALRCAGIRPDLTHVVEAQDVSHQLADGGPSEDVDLVAIPSAHSALFSTPVASRFVAYPVPNALACWIAGLCGEEQWTLGAPTVAQSAVHLAAALGANPILLIGQDLAFSEGRVYASGSAYRMVSFREVGDGRFVYTGEDEKARLLNQAARGPESGSSEIVWVPGWNGDRVPTSRQYASFIEHYREVASAHQRAGVRLVNCTEGGAYLDGLEHAVFGDTLRGAARGVPARHEIRKRFRRFQAWETRHVETGLAEARLSLRRLGETRRRSLRAFKRLRVGLARDGSPRAQADALCRLVGLERRLGRALGRVPWLEMVSQASTYRSALELRRSHGLPAVEAAIAEADALLDTTRECAERGHELLERLAKRIGELPAPVQADGGANEVA